MRKSEEPDPQNDMDGTRYAFIGGSTRYMELIHRNGDLVVYVHEPVGEQMVMYNSAIILNREEVDQLIGFCERWLAHRAGRQ